MTPKDKETHNATHPNSACIRMMQSKMVEEVVSHEVNGTLSEGHGTGIHTTDMRIFCFLQTDEKKNRQKVTNDEIKSFESNFEITRECHNILSVCQMLIAAIKY